MIANCNADKNAKTPKVAKAAKNEPLTIDADNGLECSKADGNCIAKGNVVAKKGGLILRSSQLAATLGKGSNEDKPTVKRVDATGGVKMSGAPGETAFGSRAIYEMSSSSVKLYGGTDQSATVIVGEKILHAKEISVKLDGNNKIQSVMASNDVMLSSPETIVLANNADYTPGNSMVIAKGNVIIVRKEGEMTGETAEVNIDTGHSVMHQDDNCDRQKRVRVVLLPDKIEKTAFKRTNSE